MHGIECFSDGSGDGDGVQGIEKRNESVFLSWTHHHHPPSALPFALGSSSNTLGKSLGGVWIEKCERERERVWKGGDGLVKLSEVKIGFQEERKREREKGERWVLCVCEGGEGG